MAQGSSFETRIARSDALVGTLERARDYAAGQAHGTVTLEHLLLALTEDGDAARVLVANAVDLARLRNDIASFLGQQPPGPAPGTMPLDDPDLTKILAYAEAAARQSPRPDVQIDGAIVLAAIVGDGKSMAATFLKAQGLTFQAAIRVIRQSAAAQPEAPEAPPTLQAPPPAPTSQAPASQPPAHEDPRAGARAQPGQRPLWEPVGFPSVRPDPQPRAPAPAAPPPSPRAEAPRPAAPPPRPTTRPAPELRAPPRPAQPPAAAPDNAARPNPRPSPPQTPPGRAGNATPPSPGPAATPAPRGSDPYGRPAPGPMPPPAAGRPPPLPSPDAGRRIPENPPPVPPRPLGAEAGLPPPPSRGLGAARPSPPRPSLRLPASPGPGPGPGPEPELTSPWPEAPAEHAPLPPVPPYPPPPPIRPAHAGPERGRPRAEAPPRQVRGSPRTGIEPAQLVENIPRRMKVGVVETIEVRIARENLGDGGRGLPATHVHGLVTRALSVRLQGEPGHFYIEPKSPETQWTGPRPDQLASDYAVWRFTIIPQVRGAGELTITVASRAIGADGVIADTGLPEQRIGIRVSANMTRSLKRWAGWIALAGLGALVAKAGESFWPQLWAMSRALLGI